MCHRNRCKYVFWISIFISLSTLTTSMAGAANVEKLVKPSVVPMYFWASQADVAYGTGFIIENPKHQKWIMTTAHCLEPLEGKKINSISYRVGGNKDLFWSLNVIIDQEHDLAACEIDSNIAGVPAALKIAESEPVVDHDQVYAFGSAKALPITPLSGLCNDEPITIADFASFQKLDVSRFVPLSPQLLLIRHQVAISDGFSGCPLVNENGELVGVQTMALPGRGVSNFAVHFSHVRNFDWQRKPQVLAALDLKACNIAKVMEQTSARDVEFHTKTPLAGEQKTNATIKLDGVEVDAPFIHNGYIEEHDAKTVIEKYIQDKQFYTAEEHGGMRVIRLQELLDRTKLAKIVNPVLGFQMLVPRGYRYNVQNTEQPDGLLLTFRPPADRVVPKAYQWPLSVWFRVEPATFEKAAKAFKEQADAGKFDSREYSPSEFAEFRDKWIMGYAAGGLGTEFAYDDLEIAFRGADDDDAEFFGKPGAPKFIQKVAGEAPWSRPNFFSVDSKLAHCVRIGTREPLAIVAHFQFTTDNSQAFYELDGQPDQTHTEYVLMASTISMK